MTSRTRLNVFRAVRLPLLTAGGGGVALLAGLVLLVALTLAQEGAANAQPTQSSEARLRSITLSSDADGVIVLSPSFNRNTTRYTASVPLGTSRVTMSARAQHSSGWVRYIRPDADPGTPGHQYDLQVGDNKLWIEGVAENTRTKGYIVTLTRSQFYHADATLSALTLSSGLSPSFDPATTSYTSAVLHSTTQVTVTATANDSNATVSYNSVDADSATGHQVDLDEGENIIVATVTDRDGMTSREYVIRAWRQPDEDAIARNVAGTQTTTTLASNLDFISNRFTTGPSQQGYVVNALRVVIDRIPAGVTWGVQILTDDSEAAIGSFNVANITTTGNHDVPAYRPIHLEPDTSYELRYWKSASWWQFGTITATSPGAGSESLPGWSLTNKVCLNRACSVDVPNAMLETRFYGTEVDDTAPVLSNFIIQGNKITLTYDDLLDDGSVPATSAFAVRVQFVDVTVDNVAVSGREVVLTLGSPAAEADIVVMNYTVPESNPIRNTGHHAAVTQINLGVRYVSPTRLKSLTVGGVMVPGFDPRNTVEEGHAYTFDLPYERRGSINVTATAQHGDSYTKGRVNGNSHFSGHREPATGWERLQVGANEVTIRVYSGCCSAEQLADWETYTLTINRAAPPDRFGPFNDSLPNNNGAEAMPVNTDDCRYQTEDGQRVLRCSYLYKHAERADARNIAVEVVVRPRSTDSAIRGYRILRTRYPLDMGSVWRRASYDTPERDAILTDAYVIREVPKKSWANYFDQDVDHGYCYVYAVQTVGGTEASPEYAPALHWVDPASVSNTPRYHSEVPPRCIPHYTGSEAPPDAPGAPQNLAATAGEDGVALTWDASAGADSYRVLRRNQDDALYAEIGTTTTNSYTDTTAVVAQGYAYKVQARNDSGDSEFSEHVLAMIDPPAPDAPTGFEAVVGEDSVTLSWDASDDDTITSYMVIRQVRDADPPQTVLLRRDSGETNQVTDSSPEAGAAYTYSVMAINAGGRSDAATVDVDIPAGTGGLTVTRSGLTFNLSWDETDGATSYNVLRMGPGETEHSRVATSETTSYADHPSGSGTFSYRIQPVEDGEAGDAFDPVTVEMPPPPDPPTDLQATATSSSVTLTWTAPEQTLLTYLVSRKARDADPPEDFAFLGAAASDATTYTDTTVEADTAYAYELVAVGTEFESDPVEVEADTPPASPFAGFTLVDASDQAALTTLTDVTSIELADPDGGSYGIRASLADGRTVGSVKLELSGAKAVTRTENAAPYSLYGDSYQDDASDVYGQALPAGSYTLTATAYAERNRGGDELGTLEVSFTVTGASGDPDSSRDGAVSLGAQSPDQGRQFFYDKSLDRSNGDGVDYYTFTTYGRYTLGLGARDQSIELKVTLEDADGNVVATAGPPKDPNKDQVYTEWLEVTIDVGAYYVRVEALEDAQTDYYIRFGLETPEL